MLALISAMGPESLTTAVVLNSVFKFMFIAVVILYCLFAFVVIRQIAVIKSSLITTFSPMLTLLGWGHLILSGVVLWLFITWL